MPDNEITKLAGMISTVAAQVVFGKEDAWSKSHLVDYKALAAQLTKAIDERISEHISKCPYHVAGNPSQKGK